MAPIQLRQSKVDQCLCCLHAWKAGSSVTPNIKALFQHDLINVSYLTECYLYQVMMTLHFLNDVAIDA